jgi:hypothetical protein
LRFIIDIQGRVPWYPGGHFGSDIDLKTSNLNPPEPIRRLPDSDERFSQVSLAERID